MSTKFSLSRALLVLNLHSKRECVSKINSVICIVLVSSEKVVTGQQQHIAGLQNKSNFMILVFFVSLYFSEFIAKTYLPRSFALPAFSRTEHEN